MIYCTYISFIVSLTKIYIFFFIYDLNKLFGILWTCWFILYASITFRTCITCIRYTVIHKNSWHSFSNDSLSTTVEIQLSSLSFTSCCLPYFSKVTRNPGSSEPLSPAVIYRAEYKRALFRASRRMVLLKPYLELKGLMKFAYFLSLPLRQFLLRINLDLWSFDCDIKPISFFSLFLPYSTIMIMNL